MGTRQPSDTPSLPRPLEGIRILDLTVALSGPYCSLLLAGMGADVIKVEGPKGGDLARSNPPFYGPQGFHFDAMGEGDIAVSTLLRTRNKKSITLDLKSERGRHIFIQLAKLSDVVIENMSEGTARRLGVGYDEVKAANPRIVYASISGLGDPSLFPGLKAMDIIVQALSGVMDVTGLAEGPPMRFGLPIADLIAPLYALSGILAALIQRGRTGLGQQVKVSMLECMASLLAVEHFDVFRRAAFPTRTGNHLSRLTPFGLFATRDGFVAIAAASDEWVRSLYEAMGRLDLMQDPRFSGRGPRAANANAINAIIEDWTRSLTSEQVTTELLSKRGVPCARMRSVDEVLNDPALRATGAIQALVHPRLGQIDAVGAGLPISFSAADAKLDRPAPELGSSNWEIYSGLLGMTDAELDDLKARGVV